LLYCIARSVNNDRKLHRHWQEAASFAQRIYYTVSVVWTRPTAYRKRYLRGVVYGMSMFVGVQVTHRRMLAIEALIEKGLPGDNEPQCGSGYFLWRVC